MIHFLIYARRQLQALVRRPTPETTDTQTFGTRPRSPWATRCRGSHFSTTRFRFSACSVYVVHPWSRSRSLYVPSGFRRIPIPSRYSPVSHGSSRFISVGFAFKYWSKSSNVTERKDP